MENCPYLQKQKQLAIDQPKQNRFSQNKNENLKVKTQVFDNRYKLSNKKSIVQQPTLVKSKSNKQSSKSTEHAHVLKSRQRAKPSKAKQVVVTRNSPKPVIPLITLSELKLRNANKQLWQQKVVFFY